ncbi:hypothetical protein PF008_g20649 [Phytophthora fragariae]|uniref:Uncharacterized protein n=2 Tax=Phytophthora TaxID=4783 RepID=A0A6A3M9Z3_9STRA|nr:hypothetical protein PR002_g10424 [Phytophthora rubi]KAE9309639.1 hypothetical protein PF008_g20649 [Phytophthora fragariae]
MRKSGTVEQFEERDRLLLDIIAQTDDWSDKIEADNRVKEAKQRSIESSGELMPRLAMNEIEETEDSERGKSLKSASEEEGNKYEYKTQRLALEKEEAEKQRQHHAKEAEKRRQHELELKQDVKKLKKIVKSECMNS